MEEVRCELQKIANVKSAQFLQGFFKTNNGGYGQGDKFYGITVPVQRSIAKKHKDLPIIEIIKLLKSPMHEERLIALFILVHQFKKGDEKTKKHIYDLYLANTKYVNNWDLVDSSAYNIVGEYALTNGNPDNILIKLAHSDELWERRIAIVSTYQYIRTGRSDMTFKIAKILLHDSHDLIHKAVGWMLREAGKKVSEEELEDFLKIHYITMPRTMLRYAIEKFPEEKRQKYLKGLIK